jgi:hypothetical protein
MYKLIRWQNCSPDTVTGLPGREPIPPQTFWRGQTGSSLQSAMSKPRSKGISPSVPGFAPAASFPSATISGNLDGGGTSGTRSFVNRRSWHFAFRPLFGSSQVGKESGAADKAMRKCQRPARNQGSSSGSQSTVIRDAAIVPVVSVPEM